MMNECYECEGKGIIYKMGLADNMDMDEFECENCNGTGVVSDE